ncbi:MAG: BamA/TamA family outer membrane protein, partial [Rubrobacter sp.]|nr:BamA/TamA family outer membrane protein [Rubrobacter sp.]
LGQRAPALLFGCPRNCVLSFLEQVVELDRRDDKQEPKQGFLLSFSVQEGGGFLGGSFDYLRLLPEARGYVSFLEDERLTLSAKLRVGSLLPLSGGALDTPIVARFFSGGNAMRGFSSRRLSPMLLVANAGGGKFESEPLPIGGNGLFETQLEARYGLTRRLVGAVFTDWGLVTTERFRVSALRKNLQLAVGGGLRYRTPAGPVRLDLAYRPNVGPPLQIYQSEGATPTYQRSQGCFGFGSGSATSGGSPEGPCALHLSIGEAF